MPANPKPRKPRVLFEADVPEKLRHEDRLVHRVRVESRPASLGHCMVFSQPAGKGSVVYPDWEPNCGERECIAILLRALADRDREIERLNDSVGKLTERIDAIKGGHDDPES